jgi:Tol biopolymer transport system component
MMPTDRFERQLPALLTELASPRTPDYLGDLLWQTAQSSQRPAWSLLERWLSMVDIARRPVLAPPVPWRTIGLGIAIIALLLAMLAAVAVGTRRNTPAPFGPAQNGLVVYASGGDIVSVDAATGASTPLVTGPVTDVEPRWSLDGTRFAFERRMDGGRGVVMVATADGSDLVQITPEPLEQIDSYAFSPDGKNVLITSGPFYSPVIHIAAVDGAGIRQLDLPGPATNALWRPPDGSQILFMDRGNDSDGFGSTYILDLDAGEIRTILERDASRYRAHPLWSPDGSHIVYVEWVSSNDITAQTHIMAADGTGDRLLPTPPDARWQAALSWSNDGTRLLAIRGYTGGYEESVAVAIPVDGSGFGVEIEYPGLINAACCSAWEWAPDDSLILGTPTDPAGNVLDQVLLDPVSGTSRTLPWTSTSTPTWQRLAP